jgi:DNA-binding protein H-NS
MFLNKGIVEMSKQEIQNRVKELHLEIMKLEAQISKLKWYNIIKKDELNAKLNTLHIEYIVASMVLLGTMQE